MGWFDGDPAAETKQNNQWAKMWTMHVILCKCNCNLMANQIWWHLCRLCLKKLKCIYKVKSSIRAAHSNRLIDFHIFLCEFLCRTNSYVLPTHLFNYSISCIFWVPPRQPLYIHQNTKWTQTKLGKAHTHHQEQCCLTKKYCFDNIGFILNSPNFVKLLV